MKQMLNIIVLGVLLTIPKAELANIPRTLWEYCWKFGAGMFLEYSGNIGELRLGDPLPYLYAIPGTFL